MTQTQTSYRIVRLDGSTDGLGEDVTFTSRRQARAAAVEAFGEDRASRGPRGVWSWLQIIAVAVAS